jgi:hypothetical protein
LINSLLPSIPELLVGLVGGQVEPIEAGVGTGIVGRAAPLLNREQLWAVGSVQLLHAYKISCIQEIELLKQVWARG